MAAKKKSSKKTPKGKKTAKKISDSKAMGVTNSKTGKVGTALVGAVVGELAQVAANRLAQAGKDGTGGEDGRGSNLQDSIQTASTTLKDAIADTRPPIKDAVEAVKDLAEDVRPAVSEMIDALKDTTEVAKTSAEARVKDAVDSAQMGAEKLVKQVKETAKTGKKSKSGKKKRKK